MDYTKETQVDDVCPDCGLNKEVRRGYCVEPDGRVLYVYRCKECGYMWDNDEYYDGGDEQ